MYLYDLLIGHAKKTIFDKEMPTLVCMCTQTLELWCRIYVSSLYGHDAIIKLFKFPDGMTFSSLEI